MSLFWLFVCSRGSSFVCGWLVGYIYYGVDNEKRREQSKRKRKRRERKKEKRRSVPWEKIKKNRKNEWMDGKKIKGDG